MNRFTVPVKTGRRDKTDMLLEVALNTHKTNTNLMSLECISLFKYFEICTCYVEETGEELTLSKCLEILNQKHPISLIGRHAH